MLCNEGVQFRAVPLRSIRAVGALIASITLGLAPAPVAAQQTFPSADAAADALVDAIKRSDDEGLRKALGADWKRFIPTSGIDREDVDAFLAAWEKKHSTVNQGADRAMLVVGEAAWTLPIPIVKSTAGWRFDARAAADEIKTRRIGRNELAAMQAALAYFDAQKDYARKDRNGDGALEYAQRFASSPGKRDGLYWPTKAGEDESPLGPLYAGGRPGEGYYGYHFRILTGQGKSAPGGAYDYRIKNRMVSGFALVAWPMRYGDTGVTSFIVSHDGEVHEKDLGPNGDAAARAMTRFDPDSSWQKVAVGN